MRREHRGEHGRLDAQKEVGMRKIPWQSNPTLRQSERRWSWWLGERNHSNNRPQTQLLTERLSHSITGRGEGGACFPREQNYPSTASHTDRLTFNT